MRPLFLLLLPLALAACNPTAPSEPASPTAVSVPVDAAHTDELLGAHHWLLQTATDGNDESIQALFANSDAPLQLDFSDGRLGVSGGCNRQGGNYRLEDNRLTVGPLAQTMMACVDSALMAQDAAIAALLEDGLELHLIDGDTAVLTLTTADGSTLVFAGEPTADTRYGGPGERVFLEVAAQRQSCSHPLIPDYQCLQVRDVSYAESGVKTATGEWYPLYQDIDGYEHQPGVRNVLRLNRYALRDVPADGPNVAYVLDMVVESEQVD